MEIKNDNDMPNFGEAIYFYRTKERLTQEQLSENICAREYIGKLEKGKQVPTLFIVDALSKRLEVNLFDVFALMTEHNDFDTHLKMEKLNDAIAKHNASKAYQLALSYASLPGFTYGVPLQYLKYIYALYFSNEKRDYNKSIQFALEGLSTSENVDINKPATSCLFVTEILLLLTLSVDLCRFGNFNEGKKYLKYLHECTALRCRENRYIANRNRRFDINMFALTTFNLCEFFPNNNVENLSLLEESINLLEEFKCNDKQSELLLYKSRYLYDSNEFYNAIVTFHAGYYTYIIRHSEEEAKKISTRILGERLPALLQKGYTSL